MRLLILAAFAVLFVASPMRAEEACVTTGDENNCVRVVACIRAEARWFEGRALGWESGSIVGSLSDGAACTGIWQRFRLGFGASQVRCDDGFDVTVVYTYLDPETGTAFGRATAKNGAEIEAWSGAYVNDYFDDRGGSAASQFCAEHEPPIS